MLGVGADTVITGTDGSSAGGLVLACLLLDLDFEVFGVGVWTGPDGSGGCSF